MPTPDAPPLTRGVVLRGIGFTAAIVLGAVAVWLIATSQTQKALQIGILSGLWGILLGAYSMFGARRGPSGEVFEEPGRDGREVAVRESRSVERGEDAQARRDFEARLERLIQREITTNVARETAALRSEIAHLRQELLDKVGGQLRLERIETTRLIGSDLEALQHEVRQLKAVSDNQAVKELLARAVDQRIELRQVVEPARIRPVSRPTAEVEADIRPAQRVEDDAEPIAARVERPAVAPVGLAPRREPSAPAAEAAQAAPVASAPSVAPPVAPAAAAPAPAAPARPAVAAAAFGPAAAQRADRLRSGAEARQAPPQQQPNAVRPVAPAGSPPPAARQAPMAGAGARAHQPPPGRPAETPAARPVQPAPVVPPAAAARSVPQSPPSRPVEPQRPAAPPVAPPAAPVRPAAQAPTAPPPARDESDPFASLPRIRPFTDFELDPTDPPPAPPVNGHPGAAPGTRANGAVAGPQYTGRRRRSDEPEAGGRHAGAQPEPEADPSGGRRRRSDTSDDGSDLLARLLARESSER